MTVPKRNIYHQNSNQRRIPLPWIATVVIAGLYFSSETTFSDFVSSNGVLAKIIGRSGGAIMTGSAKPESLLVYDWKDPELGSMRQHMEFVYMERDVIPTRKYNNKKYFDINYVHQHGLLHTGIWAAVIDTNVTMEDPKILLLKRGPKLVTCPNSWGLLGEHTYRDEKSKETVLRGFREELGDKFYQQFLKMKGRAMPLLKNPVFVNKDFYGDGGLVDRQMTYLYVIEMNTPSVDELQKLMKLDDEVAEVAWMTRQELQDDWLNYSPKEKFCNHELAVLLQLVLHRLEDFEHEANAPKYAALKAADDKKRAEKEAKQAAEEAAAAAKA